MDIKTLQSYDKDADKFSQDWAKQTLPVDMYDLILRFFKIGLVADVGCGNGRDIDWLTKKGFKCIGFDASRGLLEKAKINHPDLCFELSSLPGLDGIKRNNFDNVLCETVIMHLEPEFISESVPTGWY